MCILLRHHPRLTSSGPILQKSPLHSSIDASSCGPLAFISSHRASEETASLERLVFLLAAGLDEDEAPAPMRSRKPIDVLALVAVLLIRRARRFGRLEGEPVQGRGSRPRLCDGCSASPLRLLRRRFTLVSQAATASRAKQWC